MADYLDGKTRFESNAEIHNACGRFFAGLETPFTHLLDVQRWASTVHRVAAQHPDFNRSITELVFGASVEQFEAIINCRNNRGYATLLAVVNEFASDESTSLTELRFRESARCSCVTDLIAGAEAAQLQPSVEMASLAKVAKLLRTSEMKSKALESDGGVCGLIGGSAESAKRDEARLSATATYASVIAALPLQPAIIQSLLKSTANVVRFREEGKKLSDRLVDLEQKTAAAVQLGKIDPKLWCGVQLQDASVDALASRCRLALDHGDELQDYLGFLLAEERVLSAGLGPVLRAYSSVDEDYHDLPTATELVFYRSAAEQILNSDPQLKHHSGSSHELLRTQYQQLDREYLDLRRKQLAAMLLQRSVPEGNRVGKVADLTELALVQLIAGQTRPRIALRELFRRSGNAIKAAKDLTADIVDKFRGDLRKLFELDMDDGKIVQTENKEIATILPDGTTVKHIRLIVNWFESHRIIGPIGTAVKKYRKASTCKYVDEGASVVVWGPKQLATLYPVDESTILRSRHAKFLKEVQSAAELVAIENPSDFDAKMNSLAKICPAHQAPGIAGLKEALLSDWRMALAFEQKLDGTLPTLRKTLEDHRHRILQKVAQLMIASDKPWAELGRAGEIAAGVLAPDFEAAFGTTLLGAISSGEVARLIGECPVGWEAAAHA